MRTLTFLSIAVLTFTTCVIGCGKSDSQSTPEATSVESPSGDAARGKQPGAAAAAPQGKAGSPTVGQDGTVKTGNVEVKANGDTKTGGTETKANGDVKAGNVEVKDGTVKVPGLPPIQTGQ